MNTAIFFLHCLVTLLVPGLFGWVVLRRVAREHDWLVLVPGSLVVGMVALMALMNELRFVFAMDRSVWFAYKLLLLFSLGIVLATRRLRHRPLLPRSAGSAWRVGLVIGGAALSAVFFGIPANRGILNDAWWFHYPTATQIQTSALFPLAAPFAPDDPLYYHIGPDILAATWAQLFDRAVPFGFVCNVLLLAPATFALAFALILRLSRSYVAALASAGVLLVGGNLRFLGLLQADFGQPASLLGVFNSQTVEGLLELMFTPSHALGIPAVLAGLVLFRHFAARPGWPLAATLGLWMGALTLIAEWYFIPFFGGVCVWVTAKLWHTVRLRRPFRPVAAVYLLAILAAPAWAFFNNTYAAGIFVHFWWRPVPVRVAADTRQTAMRLAAPARLLGPLVAGGDFDGPLVAGGDFETPAPFAPPWSPPALLPLRLNTGHFGRVPSWEGAGSDGETFVPLASWRFLSEALPVIGLGLPFAIWLWWRKRHPVVFLVAFMASSALVPPVFLDWGYRSSDFLRFFTCSFSLSALGCGWLLGWLWERNTARHRAGAVALAVAAFSNPVGLGLVGLMPRTLDVVQDVSARGVSLSAQGSKPGAPVTPVAAGAVSRDQALPSLAAKLDGFLTPLAGGRDRVIVVVSRDQLPPLEVFPDWLKLSTLSKLILPIGWHWNDSIYAAYYRNAVNDLRAEALAALDAKWVIVSNLFQPQIPADVETALRDRTRFAPAARFREGTYYLQLYRVLP